MKLCSGNETKTQVRWVLIPLKKNLNFDLLHLLKLLEFIYVADLNALSVSVIM